MFLWIGEATALNVVFSVGFNKRWGVWHTICNKVSAMDIPPVMFKSYFNYELISKTFYIMETVIIDCLNWLLFWLRLDAPSLRGSFISSSWLPSPGCVWRGSSCTSCLWRSLKVNTRAKSTTTCLVTSFLPSWSASLQLLTTGATGQRKRKCSFLNKSLQMQSRHAGCFTVWAYLLCLYVAAFEKKSTHHFCQCLMCLPGDYTKTFELLLPGMGSCSIFYVIWKWLTDSTLWFRGGGVGGSYINASLLKDPPVTSCL